MFAETIRAEEVVSTQQKSSITITVVKNQAYIKSVEVPLFETAVKESSSTSVIYPKTDLVIQIADEREEKYGSWKLNYQLDVFALDDGTEAGEQKIHIGQGTLTTDGKWIDPADYQTNEVTLTTKEKQKTLVESIKGTADNYVYRVQAKNIKIELPEGIKAGTYKSEQVITLWNVPYSQ